MPLSQIINFDDANNFTFDDDLIDITTMAKLKILEGNFDYNQPFDSDVGFVYDSSKAEFTGGKVQQKDQTPSSAMLGVKFETSKLVNWAKSSYTESDVGTSAIETYGYSVHDALAGRLIDCAALGNCQNEITIEFDYTPFYSGPPAGHRFLFELRQNGSNANRIYAFHTSTGFINLVVYNSGSILISSVNYPFSPTALNTYKLAFIGKWTDGDRYTQVFSNGVSIGKTTTASMVRGDTAINFLMLYNTAYNADGAVKNLRISNSALYLTVYTPSYTIPEARYIANNIVLPEMQHSGIGTLKLFNSFATVEANAPRYTVQVGRSGDYLYHNGSAWVVSDNTYAQANTASDFNANCQDIDIDAQIYGQFKVLFTDSNNQQSVSDLLANVRADLGYSTDSPTIRNNSGIFTDQLVSFLADVSEPTNTEIRFQVLAGVLKKWFNGTAWSTTTGGVEESNTWEEINDNLGSLELPAGGVEVKLMVFLSTTDTQETPIITSASMAYNFYQPIPDEPAKCYIYGHTRDIVGDLQTSDFTLIVINSDFVPYDETFIEPCTKEATADEFGEFQIELVETESTGTKYLFKAKYYDDYKARYKTKTLGYATVPNLTEKALATLEFSTTP